MLKSAGMSQHRGLSLTAAGIRPCSHRTRIRRADMPTLRAASAVEITSTPRQWQAAAVLGEQLALQRKPARRTDRQFIELGQLGDASVGEFHLFGVGHGFLRLQRHEVNAAERVVRWHPDTALLNLIGLRNCQAMLAAELKKLARIALHLHVHARAVVLFVNALRFGGSFFAVVRQDTGVDDVHRGHGDGAILTDRHVFECFNDIDCVHFDPLGWLLHSMIELYRRGNSVSSSLMFHL